MKGMMVVGTNNTSRMIARMVRIHHHSDPRHMALVSAVYHRRHGKRLVDRVKKETKGPLRDLLVRLIEAAALRGGAVKREYF
jgi:hypothetical protein